MFYFLLALNETNPGGKKKKKYVTVVLYSLQKRLCIISLNLIILSKPVNNIVLLLPFNS